MDEQQRDFYRLSPAETLRQLRSSEEGLSTEEAYNRIADFGKNVLDIKHHEPLIITFFKQFKDLMIWLLIVSGSLSVYLGDERTGIVLWILALFNTLTGFMQEYKTGKVMASLEKLIVATASVKRNGNIVKVPTPELVVGDVVYIEEGDSVPADLRVLTEEELSTNDFALTGESNPSRKFVHAIDGDVTLGERGNIVFMGTTVATGNCFGVVISTGLHTELGRIATLSQQVRHDSSPLQKEMNNIALRVTQGVLFLCILLLPLAIHAGLPFRDAFLFAIGIACSVVPNGLPAAISTSLAGAAGRLARLKALVKKLSAVETLGATGVICTDKTGTLTKNQMTVERLLINKTYYTVSGTGYTPEGTIMDESGKELTTEQLHDMDIFFTAGVMASNARVNAPDDQHPTWYCIGDPTEGAIVTLGMKAGVDSVTSNKKTPELRELTFDSARKRMTSIRHYGTSKQLYAFVKGSPESVLAKCTAIWDHGHTRPLTKKDRDFILAENTRQAAQALRNLAFAYRVLPEGIEPKKTTIDETEQELVWLGMVSMIDPLRDEVAAAMEAARGAHVKVSIVTGDNAVTAKAIALRAKLADRDEDIIVVTGEELAQLSDTQIITLGERGSVIFSRVAPEDKLRIVNLVQQSGRVVAVTGDGINDAPALKRADIGVAMGQTGTDVAKQSAGIVLLDDSFSTLVRAIQEGRVIFQNIKKATICSFTGNGAELIVNLVSLAATTLLHIPLALSVIQILAIDVIAELFPVAALGNDKADRNVMEEEPRDTRQHILNRQSVFDILWCGLLIGGLAYANYYWFFSRHGLDPQSIVPNSEIHWSATSLTYVTLMLCLLMNILMRRSANGLFTRYQLHNKLLWIAMILSLASIMIIVYSPIAPYFKSAPIGIVDWLYALGAAAVFVAVREFQRWSNKHHSRAAVLALKK